MTYIRHNSHQRTLKPRVNKQSPLPIFIQELSFLNIEGSTRILIHPSRILIESKELLNMIEEKSDMIPLENGLCALREDIFLATETALENVQDGTSRFSDFSLLSTSNEPKRPTNAFILYRNSLRKRVKQIFPEFNNSQISKFLGAMWKNASSEVKEKYVVQAIEYRRAHKEAYPNFEYNPRRETFESSYFPLPSTQLNEGNSLFDINFPFNDLLQSSSSDGLTWFPDLNGILIEGSLSGQSNYYPDISLAEPDLIYNDYYQPTEGLSSSSEWDLVCNTISELFPEDLDQSRLIDEKLWSSLENLEQFKNFDILNSSLNGYNFENFNDIEGFNNYNDYNMDSLN